MCPILGMLSGRSLLRNPLPPGPRQPGLPPARRQPASSATCPTSPRCPAGVPEPCRGGSRHTPPGPAAAQGSSRAKRSSWSVQKGKTCHHFSHGRSPWPGGPRGDGDPWVAPGRPLGVSPTLTGRLFQHPQPPCPGVQGCSAHPEPRWSYLRRAGGAWGTPCPGQDAGRHLSGVPKGKSQDQQRGIPPAAVPAAPCLPRHPPHPGCALFACYFWQPPKSSSQAINNESEKFVWPLLYKER